MKLRIAVAVAASALAFPTIRSAVLQRANRDTQGRGRGDHASRPRLQPVGRRPRQEEIPVPHQRDRRLRRRRPDHGHNEILKGWGAFFDPSGPTLTWEPTRAAGPGRRRRRRHDRVMDSPNEGADGKASEARGQYVTTWRTKGWRVAGRLRHRLDRAVTAGHRSAWVTRRR